jgi:hypothetical protein
MMTERDTRIAVGAFAQYAIESIELDFIMRRFPDPADAERVHHALRTADIHVQWREPYSGRMVKVVAVAGSPILLPVLAAIWLGWRIRDMMISVRRWRKGGTR